MRGWKSGIPPRNNTRYANRGGLNQGRRAKSENLIFIDGESVSVSLLVQNPGLDRAQKDGSGSWCLCSPCRNHSTCQHLHPKEWQPEHPLETNISTVQMALELATLEDPLNVILSEEPKRKGFQNLLRSTDLVNDLLPIVHRIISSLDNTEAPLSEDLVDVRMWCDAWIIRSTEQTDKLHALPPDLQKSFFSLVYDVCKRDPTSPDTRRALAEISKLPSISPEERQKAADFLQDTESNITMTERNEESDEKQKRYVVSKMYHKRAIPVFNSAVWPTSAMELRSGFSELRALPGLVVDRFIPSELRGLHLRALQHLSRADFMHSMNEIATTVQNRRNDVFKTSLQQIGHQQRFDMYQLTFLHVKSTPNEGLTVQCAVQKRRTLQKAEFLSGDLVLLWQEGIAMKDENCFIAVVQNEKSGVVALSPVDLLRLWPILKPQARFLLVQSQNFYLPTAASLTQLHIQESKVAENKEPDLLRALICGDAAKDPPIYLQHNPPIEIGRCVALRDGSESKQPALNDWPCRDWSEEAEKEISKTSDGEMALLDRTQLEALQHIMRNRVAVVQGTPGTGKSFVGSKFLQILLRNTKKLGIGPIIVMTFTHHALESFFESLVHFYKRYGVNIGLIGNPKSEEMKKYVIHMRHKKSEYAKELNDVIKRIDVIKSYTTVSMKAEERILDVMEKQMDPLTYTEWKQKCRMHREKWQSMQNEYDMLSQEVSEELYIPIPDSLNALEQMSLALKTNQWHGEVDIMPFLMKHFPGSVNPHYKKIRDSLNEIAALKRKVPLNESSIDTAIKDVENCFSILNDGQNTDVPAKCLETFVRGLEKLIDMKRSMPAEYISPMESWRIEGMPDGHTLPPLADTTTAASERVEDTNKTDAVDAQLQQFKREEEERRRQERDLDDDVEELDEKNQMAFLSLPTKEERDALARDACNRIATAPPGEERSQLLSVLLQESMYCLQEKLNTLVTKINEEKEVLKKEEAVMNAREFERYAVIGATSTKLMLTVDAIQRCGASVLVVEEAAEVLESHLLACITKSMQHVVLIGDHKQLKPKVNEYVLERHQNLAVSTMERLVLCGMPCVTITMQRRMTPEISDLTKPYYRRSNVAGDTAVTIEDHPRTQSIPPPFGVCREDGTPIRLFFMSHDGQGEKAEGMRNSLTSPDNIFEAKIVACIAQYLMNVNKGKSITILTPYSGQKLALFKELELLRVPRRSKFIGTNAEQVFEEGVRLSTVDDYQGEEDDIIILSLVRTEKHGFLRLDNRACVALSRARSALYVVGCGTLLSGASALWANLERHCRERKSIGTRFPARCNRHPDRDLSFGSAKEYELHGACCTMPCNATLECGHQCGGECGLCSQRNFHSDCKVPGKALVCGHNSKLGCTATVNICEEPCAFYCGHGTPCNKLSKNALHKCSECPSRVCKKLCQWQCPHGKCSKKCSEPCEFEVTEDNSVALSSGCWRRCERNLSCGHRCCGLCGERCPPFCRECYSAGNKKALALANKVVTYTEGKELEILRTDNSVESQSLAELPCCQMIFAAKELHDLFASKAEEKEINALTCPQCRAIVLPNAFLHAGVFVKKRLLQASHIMRRVHDAANEKTNHGVSEVISCILSKSRLSNNEKLVDAVELARKEVAIQRTKYDNKEDLEKVWLAFCNSCSKLDIEKKWIMLLQYHIEILENAIGNMGKNGSRIAQNANLLAKAALRFTTMSDTLSEKVLLESSLKNFCALILYELVQKGELAKSFPSANAHDKVQCFCQRMEWTYLIYRIQSHAKRYGHALKDIVLMGKLFAKRGVKPDEVDRARKVKQQINAVIDHEISPTNAQYAGKTLGISAGHWFGCPEGHIYTFNDCDDAKETSVCPECLDRGYGIMDGSTSLSNSLFNPSDY